MVRSCFYDLLISMAEEGYLPDKKSSFATEGIGLAIVWRDGNLWHEYGATHRLASAKIVGLRRGFPLRVVAAHRDWLGTHGIRSLSEISRLPGALQTVNGVLSNRIGDHC